MATQTVAAAGGSWSASATWSPGSVPAAGDDVVLNASSGQLTIDVNTNSIRSLVCTGYTGTITHNSGITLNIGYSTAPVSNIALLFVGTETYTLGSATTSAINIADTSGATNTYNFAGKTIGNLTINNGTTTTTELVTNGFLQASAATFTVTQGGFNSNNQNFTCGTFSSSNSNTRAITFGTSTVTILGGSSAFNISTGTNGTWSIASSTITMSGSSASATFTNLATIGTVNFTGSGAAALNNSSSQTFTNLNVSMSAATSNTFQIQGNHTITGTLTLAGNSVTNRLLVFSSTPGTARTLTCNGTLTTSNLDLQDITGAGSVSWNLASITGNSGNCLGNSGITFTTAVAQTWTGNTTGNWSNSANWTSRVPLPQDNVSINGLTSGTITCDIPRMGANVDFTSSTGGTINTNTVSLSLYGYLTLVSGLTFSGTNTIALSGRSALNFTTAGLTLSGGISLNAPGGTYTLIGNFTSNGHNLSVQEGTLDAATNNVNLSFNEFFSTSGNASQINMGSGTWTVTQGGNGTGWSVSNSNLTVSAGTSTISFTNTGSGARTFAGGGLTYYNLTLAQGTSATYIITGANTFNNLTYTGGVGTLTLPSVTTTTINGRFNVNGAVSNLMTVNASTPTSAATLSQGTGLTQNCHYLSLQDNTATGGNGWFAGTNSSEVSNVTGWTLGDPTLSLPNATLSFVGSESKKTTMLASATLSFMGAYNRLISYLVSANLSFMGLLSRSIKRTLIATLSFMGGLSKKTVFILATATVAFIGAITKLGNKSLTATQGLSGLVGKYTYHAIGGIINLSGSVLSDAGNVFIGVLSFIGSLFSKHSRPPIPAAVSVISTRPLVSVAASRPVVTPTVLVNRQVTVEKSSS